MSGGGAGKRPEQRVRTGIHRMSIFLTTLLMASLLLPVGRCLGSGFLRGGQAGLGEGWMGKASGSLVPVWLTLL